MPFLCWIKNVKLILLIFPSLSKREGPPPTPVAHESAVSDYSKRCYNLKLLWFPARVCLFVFAIILHLINWIHSPFSFVPFSSSCSYNKINVNEPRKLKKEKKSGKKENQIIIKKESLWGPETAWGRVSFLPDSLQRNLVCNPPFTPSLPEQRYVCTLAACFPSDILETEETRTIYWKKISFSPFLFYYFLKGNFLPIVQM